MPAVRTDRCPHCWASLPENVGPHCIHCGRSLLPTGRRARRAAEGAGTGPGMVSPPAASPPATDEAPAYESPGAYQPPSYEPPSYAPPTHDSPVTYEPSADEPPNADQPAPDDEGRGGWRRLVPGRRRDPAGRRGRV